MKNLNRRQTVWLTIVIVPLLAVLVAMMNGIRFYCNLTYSLPHTFYMGNGSKPSVWKRGDYIVFSHPKYPNQAIIKQIKGLPGDLLGLQDSQVTIDQTLLILLRHNSNGELLKPLSIKSVPVDKVFVVGHHPRSFDSRYEEFGLIPQSHIKGQVWPLF